MVQAIEGDIKVETLRETPQTASQPAFQPDPVKLDEKQVRAAMMDAASKGVDPFTVTVGDLANGIQPNQAPPPQARTPVDVPEKFKKPNGEVDVDKLKASTERLNEEIQKKETILQKSVDDYLQAEKKFRNLPNAGKLEQTLSPVPQMPMAPPPMAQAPMLNRQQIEAQINADLAANPAATVANLIDIMFEQKFGQKIKPLEEGIQYTLEQRRNEAIRSNLKELSERDPRILREDVFNAVNAKLQDDPKLWELKNPHKAAWLEVKEDMRLGDLAASGLVQAQPSKSAAPILGGGTPPPAPSLSESRTSFQTLDAAISQLSFDPRAGKIDPNHQKALDQAAKEFFDAQERFRPR